MSLNQDWGGAMLSPMRLALAIPALLLVTTVGQHSTASRSPGQPVVWMAAPVARDCVCEVVAAVGVS
ncbi:MAG: hypothetical protein ACRDNB_02270 [Gaiellaceae bacterium]